MRIMIFFIITLIGVSSILQASEMTPEEAQERAQHVMLGGD